MLRFILLISLLLSSLTLVESTSATVIYTPGASIAMTGSNTDARFDVASALYDLQLANPADEVKNPPALDRDTRTFTGTFYGSGIGWIVFASGSNQVSLDCGAQLLSSLTANCTLTGTGWNENVGDIYFAGVVYNPGTGRLSGSAITFVGDISLTGIALPLRPVTLDQSTLTANHIATLSVANAWMYDAGALGWVGSAAIGLDSQSITGNKGVYNNIDLSLTNDNYTITIEDTNGSITEITGFIVSPNIVATTITTAPSYYAATFCSSSTLPDPNCPDGATRSATTLTRLPVGPVVANGTDAYSFTLKARDQYGNRVESGMMKITYTTTVKNVQTDPLSGTDNPNYGPSTDGDAFISDKIPTGFFGTSDATLTLTPTDITYTIASTAPTNTNNKIELNSITYTAGPDIALPGWKTALSFDPLFIATVSSVDAPIVNTPHTFETQITGTHPTITPTIITTMQIGDGSMAEWRSLSSDPTAECSNYPMTLTMNPLCDWSGVSVIATSSVSGFAYTGTYTTWLPSAATDMTTMTGYIYYHNGVTDILYSLSNTPIDAATAATQRIRVLGQSGEGVGGGASTRVDLIGSIRKQTALLSRNRTNYDDVDYLVVNGNHTITLAELNGGTGIKAKRSIIAIGGDIIIDANISLRDYPIVLIALTDGTGNGGNIRIKGDVTDIHSSLIAEHGIISDRSDSQLYIHGSLVSANPPREIAPTGCPYFVAAGCTRSDYDLPGSRDAYAALTDTTGKSSIGGSTYPSPLVIEGDPRIIRDPAPAMSK